MHVLSESEAGSAHGDSIKADWKEKAEKLKGDVGYKPS
jgi:hypothetical protein